ALAEIHRLVNEIYKAEGSEVEALIGQLKYCTQLIGLLTHAADIWFQGDKSDTVVIEGLIAARLAARQNKDFALADQIRVQLTQMGIILDDGPSGTTWRRG